MGKWKHRLSAVDTEKRTATCAHCGPVTIRVRGYTHNQLIIWRCNSSDRASRNAANKAANRPRNHPYRRHKAPVCGNPDCTAPILASCQLDVHHIDGNHRNNDPANLTTLCANCHRLQHTQKALHSKV